LNVARTEFGGTSLDGNGFKLLALESEPPPA